MVPLSLFATPGRHWTWLRLTYPKNSSLLSLSYTPQPPFHLSPRIPPSVTPSLLSLSQISHSASSCRNDHFVVQL